jgi:hypothetical protein
MHHESRNGNGHMHVVGASFKSKIQVRRKRGIYQSCCRKKNEANGPREFNIEQMLTA